MLGQTIGDYELIEPLGQGGMGIVYRARRAWDGRSVALKTVRAANEVLLGGLRREIAALAKLRHPGIVPILESGVSDGLPWYAMDLVEGVQLHRWAAATTKGAPEATRTSVEQETLANDRDFDEEDPAPKSETRAESWTREALLPVLGLLRRLCSALAYMHGEGIVHRDLKPGNILVRPDGSPVIVDFGLASSFGARIGRESLEVAGGVSGTLAYMAPEQIRGELVDARADLYSLGCILYEILTGRRPFLGNEYQLIWQHFSKEPTPLSSLAGGIDAELEHLVLRLLEKEPRLRFGYAADVAARLERLVGPGEPAEREPVPRPYLYRAGFEGRSRELGLLGAALGELRQGRRVDIWLVVGESGAGKTRLLLELSRQAIQAKMQVLVGECLAVGGGPLHPLREPLRRLADRCREKGPGETRRLFGEQGRLLAAYEPALASLPGLETCPEPVALPPEAARTRLVSAITRTLGEGAAEQPLLLILDDLQWADGLTLSWLESWRSLGLEALERSRVLVVGTARAEELNELGELGELAESSELASSVKRLELGRLEVAAVAAMVGDMLALSPPPRLLSEFLARQSEGNPFFVAEFLHAAVGEGLLWRDAQGYWQVAEPGEQGASEQDLEALALPRSLLDLVDRRLAGVPEAALRVACSLAVLGREAPLEWLERLEPGAGEHLQELKRRYVLEEPTPGQVRFVHDKLREVCYARIEATSLGRLHRGAAELIESLPEPGIQAAALWRHWEQAGEPARAAQSALQSARHARDRYAFSDAERLYRHAVRLGEPRTRAMASLELGDGVLAAQGRMQEGQAELESALEQARSLGERPLELKALCALGDLFVKTGQGEGARHRFGEALVLAGELGDRAAEAQAWSGLGGEMRVRGVLEESREFYQKALELQRGIQDRAGEASTLNNLGSLVFQQGSASEAREFYELALAAAQASGSRRVEGIVLGNLSGVLQAEGLHEEASGFIEQALRIHRETGNRRSEGIALANLASLLYHHDGDPDRVLQLLLEAIQLHTTTRNQDFEASAQTMLGVVLIEQGRPEEARAPLERALDLSRRQENQIYEAYALRCLARMESTLGHREKGARISEEAVALARQTEDRAELALCLVERARQLLAQGQRVEALLEEVEQIFEGLDVRYNLDAEIQDLREMMKPRPPA